MPALDPIKPHRWIPNVAAPNIFYLVGKNDKGIPIPSRYLMLYTTNKTLSLCVGIHTKDDQNTFIVLEFQSLTADAITQALIDSDITRVKTFFQNTESAKQSLPSSIQFDAPSALRFKVTETASEAMIDAP